MKYKTDLKKKTVGKKEKCGNGQERIIGKGQGNLDQGERMSSSEMKEKGNIMERM
jgi:hypothetical protein